jgi:type I restriction enzyme R subunit
MSALRLQPHRPPAPAEQRARVRIDLQLEDIGWAAQNRDDLNPFTGQGVALSEAAMAPGHGRVDHLLHVDRAVVGVIEADPEGTTLGWVEGKSARYGHSGAPPGSTRRP